MRDQSKAQQIRQALGNRRDSTVIVDPGRWRHTSGTPSRPLDLPPDGLTAMSQATWASTYLGASNADAVFTPSLFIETGDWAALQALRDALAVGLPGDGKVVGLIPTHASMLDPGVVTRFLAELAPLRKSRLGFVFAGGREALANSDRVAALQTVLRHHPGAWLLGVDALIASDALCAGAGLVAVGIRSGMRWPAAPGTSSNNGFAIGHVPGCFHRDLLTYRSPVVYGHWYLDSVPSACAVCGLPPTKYLPSEDDKNRILAHNVHAAAYLCAELMLLEPDERHAWLSSERTEAADRYRELDRSQREVDIDRTLVALIRRDLPGWTAPAWAEP
ncbi:hypothetical protein ACRCUN_22825 [Mycobacterium sp. LTG2003]